MTTDNIDIKNILTDKSRYSLKDILFSSEEHSYNDSFEKLGIVNPIIVWREGESFHLVDGGKRIKFGKQKGMIVTDAVVLPENTLVTDIITLILCDKREDVGSSVMNRVQFICFAVSLNAPEEWMVESLCAPLGLKPHPNTLRACEEIIAMPKELRLFCHDKKFSLKQLINLASYPDDLLGFLVEWSSTLHLTASTMDEIASNLRGWLRSKNKSVDDLMNDAEIREILDSSMDPRDKTGRLRDIIHIRQFPVLSGVNSKIEKSVSNLKLPKEIGIKWDRTLENKKLGIFININDSRMLEEMVDIIGSEKVRAVLKEILDEL